MSMPKPYNIVQFSVEAMELTSLTVQKAASWTGGVEIEEIDANDSTKKFVGLNIPTIHGVERVQEGDYIVKDPKGNFAKVSREDFQQYFIPVSGDNS